MFTRIEANRLQTNGDYKNTVDSLTVSARVDETSDPSSDADVVMADFRLYQSQNSRVEHSVLREQPQYLLVGDKKESESEQDPEYGDIADKIAEDTNNIIDKITDYVDLPEPIRPAIVKDLVKGIMENSKVEYEFAESMNNYFEGKEKPKDKKPQPKK